MKGGRNRRRSECNRHPVSELCSRCRMSYTCPHVHISVRACPYVLLGSKFRTRYVITATITQRMREPQSEGEEEAEETQERPRQAEKKEICAKNNDRPIQRLYTAGTHITGRN